MNNSLAAVFNGFSNSAMANLEYWIRVVDELPNKDFTHLELEPNLTNLVSAFRYGIVSPETFELAVKFLVRISPIFASLPAVDNWIELVRSAINNAPEGCQGEICTLQNQLGYLYSLNNQPESARISYSHALAQANHSENTFERANANLGLAKSYWEQKQYKQAQEYAQGVAEELSNNSDINTQRVAALYILGMAAYTQTNYPEAKKYFQDVLKLDHYKPKGRRYAIALCNLAITHFAQKNFAQCLRSLARSRRILSKWPSNFWTMKLDYVYGITFLKLGELDKAEKCFLRAITFCFQRIPNPNLIAHLYQCLGITLQKSAKNKLADLYLEKSADLLNPSSQFSPNAVDDLRLENS